MCDVLQVARPGFYAWKKRPASVREALRDALASEFDRSIPSDIWMLTAVPGCIRNC